MEKKSLNTLKRLPRSYYTFSKKTGGQKQSVEYDFSVVNINLLYVQLKYVLFLHVLTFPLII